MRLVPAWKLCTKEKKKKMLCGLASLCSQTGQGGCVSAVPNLTKGDEQTALLGSVMAVTSKTCKPKTCQSGIKTKISGMCSKRVLATEIGL